MRKIRIKLNQLQGAIGEELFRSNAIARDKQVIRTGRGSDYAIRNKQEISGKPYGRKNLYEIKTGNAIKSAYQKKKKSKLIRIPFSI